MGRSTILNAGAAKHLGIAALNEAASFCKLHKISCYFDRAQFIKCPSILSGHKLLPFSAFPQSGLDCRNSAVIVIPMDIDLIVMGRIGLLKYASSIPSS
jgi:hypothetical protein